MTTKEGMEYRTSFSDLKAQEAQKERELQEIRDLIRLLAKYGQPVPDSPVSNSADKEKALTSQEPSVLKPGGIAHVASLIEATKADRTLRPKAYLVEQAMNDAPGLERDLIDQRVTNSLQILKNTKKNVAKMYKTDGTNQSAVWGPVDAFDGDKPKRDWKW